MKETITRSLIAAAAVAALAFGAGPGFAAETSLVVDSFSGPSGAEALPPGWKPLIFSMSKRPTTYTVQKESSGYALKAQSARAASGIYKELDFDLRDYPVLSWRWKVNRVMKNGNALTRDGDDYPARIYVAFEFEEEKASYFDKIKHMALKSVYGDSIPGRAITYIWANRLKRGAVTPNPFLAQSVMIAVESGPERAEQWVTEERDVYEDFKKCFNEEPPRVTGVIVMTDTDNTSEDAEAWYDDIVFKRKAAEHPYPLADKAPGQAAKAPVKRLAGKGPGM